MQVQGSVAVVTGGASGLGEAVVRRFLEQGAAGVTIIDMSEEKATKLAGGVLVVDNTFATHLLCQPLRLGADFVVESLGKQVNGHSDGMAGFAPRRRPVLSNAAHGSLS